jgi:tetratricopeptide (TPR) repeat protein
MDRRFEYLFQIHKISLSELARRSQITPGYLSKIVNGKTQNVSLGILARISKQLSLPTDELYRMVKDKDFLPVELADQITNFEPPIESLEAVLQNALDALESNNHEEFQFWSNRINDFPSPLQKCYEKWFEGLQLAYENLYEPALERFLAAQQLKARSTIERRFKAKVLFGIASLYLGKGDYKNALSTFRKSLITWEEGTHAGTVYLNMGTLNRRNGAYKSAELCYRSALITPAPSIQLLAYAALGQLYMDLQNFSEARSTLLQGYCLARKLPSDRGKGELYCNLGKYYKEIGRLEKSTKLLKHGLTYTTAPSSKRTRQYILTELIDAYFTLEQSGVEPFINSLHGEGFAEGDVLLVGKSMIMIAKEKIRNAQFSQAVTLLQQCYRLLSQIYPTEELISCCSLLAECFHVLKDPYQSEFFLKEIKRLRKITMTRTSAL